MKKKGFTLVELVIVIAVIGVLAAVCLPIITGQIRGGQIRADRETAQMLTNACKRAAMENSINAGREEYVPIEFIYDESGATQDVFELGDINVAAVTPKTRGGAFVYNRAIRQVKLLEDTAQPLPSGFSMFINDKGEVTKLSL